MNWQRLDREINGGLQAIRLERQTQKRLLQAPVSPLDGDFKSFAESEDGNHTKIYPASLYSPLA